MSLTATAQIAQVFVPRVGVRVSRTAVKFAIVKAPVQLKLNWKETEKEPNSLKGS